MKYLLTVSYREGKLSTMDSFGIYLHIPYCKAKCRYCDFYSAPGARGVPQPYVQQLRHPAQHRLWLRLQFLRHRT